MAELRPRLHERHVCKHLQLEIHLDGKNTEHVQQAVVVSQDDKPVLYDRDDAHGSNGAIKGVVPSEEMRHSCCDNKRS